MRDGRRGRPTAAWCSRIAMRVPRGGTPTPACNTTSSFLPRCLARRHGRRHRHSPRPRTAKPIRAYRPMAPRSPSSPSATPKTIWICGGCRCHPRRSASRSRSARARPNRSRRPCNPSAPTARRCAPIASRACAGTRRIPRGRRIIPASPFTRFAKASAQCGSPPRNRPVRSRAKIRSRAPNRLRSRSWCRGVVERRPGHRMARRCWSRACRIPSRCITEIRFAARSRRRRCSR